MKGLSRPEFAKKLYINEDQLGTRTQSNTKDLMNHLQKQSTFTNIENRLCHLKGNVGVKDKLEFKINTYTDVIYKTVKNKIPLYSRGNYTCAALVITMNKKNLKENKYSV